MDVRTLQKPLKEKYRGDPEASRITLRALGGQSATPIACSVDIGRAVYEAHGYSYRSASIGSKRTARRAKRTFSSRLPNGR